MLRFPVLGQRRRPTPVPLDSFFLDIPTGSGLMTLKIARYRRGDIPERAEGLRVRTCRDGQVMTYHVTLG